jgi:hypothetical protein
MQRTLKETEGGRPTGVPDEAGAGIGQRVDGVQLGDERGPQRVVERHERPGDIHLSKVIRHAPGGGSNWTPM